MGFGFKQPLVGEKRCVMTQITAAKETMFDAVIKETKKCSLSFIVCSLFVALKGLKRFELSFVSYMSQCLS